MTHTKGPWHTTVIDTINGAPAMWAICDIQKGFIATVDSVNEADARLIAAAPDLLELVAAFASFLRDDSRSERRRAQCLAEFESVLARAKVTS